MDIRLYIGAHRAATKHMREMLAKNTALLESQGICVPEAGFAEKTFAAAVKEIRHDGDPIKISNELFEKLTGGKPAKRIVLVDPNISGTVLRPFGNEFFYPRIGNTITRIGSTFNGVPFRLFIALRNPATFIPSCYAESLRFSQKASFEEYISQTNLQSLRWSDFLHRAQLKKAYVGITTWRYEDYPRIWRDVLQALTGLENKEDLVGATDPVYQGISLKGAVLLHTFLKEHPPSKKGDFARIIETFLQKFPSIQNEVYLPSWPEELTTGMRENYEDDWYYIERMENVETIQPRIFS